MANMLLEELQTKIDYSTLPEEVELAWLEICDVVLDLYEGQEAGKYVWSAGDVVEAVQLAAEGLNFQVKIPQLAFNSPSQSTAIAELENYIGELRHELAKRSFTSALSNRTKLDAIASDDALQIANATLVAIHPKLQSLRNSVARVDMSDEKRQKMLDLLNEFERELNTKEVSKSKTLKRLATVGAIILGTTTFLAEAPEAMETLGQITAHVGAEIEAADEVNQLEAQSQQLLAAPEDTKTGPS